MTADTRCQQGSGIVSVSETAVEHTMTEQAEDIGSVFRHLHDQTGVFVIPNPWDVGSARMLASLGFKALATTSAGFAFSMGVCEGTVSPESTMAHCKAIVEATPLPVSADLEQGFGDSPEAVADCIERAAAVGLAGGSIEDYSGDPAHPIYDFDLAVDRISAAVSAAKSLPRDFVLTARCENFLWKKPDVDDTIARLQAFEKVGADVLYAPGLRDLDLIGLVCSSVSKPVNVVMGMPGSTFTVEELRSVGVKRISVGSTLARLAYGSLISGATEMAEEGTFEFSKDAIGFKALESHL